MPAIEQIQIQKPTIGRDRIQELKARVAEGLDDALNVVAVNLGKEEARKAEISLMGMGDELAAQEGAVHRLDQARVMDLISDPFEDD